MDAEEAKAWLEKQMSRGRSQHGNDIRGLADIVKQAANATPVYRQPPKKRYRRVHMVARRISDKVIMIFPAEMEVAS